MYKRQPSTRTSRRHSEQDNQGRQTRSRSRRVPRTPLDFSHAASFLIPLSEQEKIMASFRPIRPKIPGTSVSSMILKFNKLNINSSKQNSKLYSKSHLESPLKSPSVTKPPVTNDQPRPAHGPVTPDQVSVKPPNMTTLTYSCLLYTSDAADE